MAALVALPEPNAHAQAWREADVLQPSDGTLGGGFGSLVSVSENRALVMAPRGRTGYVFEYSAEDGWTETAVLQSATGNEGDGFGASISLNGDRAIIGAPNRRLETSATTVLWSAGAAEIFERNSDGDWTGGTVLRASDAEIGQKFGGPVAISGDRALVAAQNGTPRSVYVFERRATGRWIEVAILRPSTPGGIDRFGGALAIDGDRAIIGGTLDASGSSLDAVYVFERKTDGRWTEVGVLNLLDAGGLRALSLDGHRAFIGGTNRSLVFDYQSDGTWIERQEIREVGHSLSLDGDRGVIGTHFQNGVARVYERQPDESWSEEVLLQQCGRYGEVSSHGFGSSVSIEGPWLFVGVPGAHVVCVFELSTDAHTASVSGPGLVRFGTTGVSVEFASSTSGSGDVSVVRFGSSPSDASNIPERIVSRYRLVITAAAGVTLGPGNRVRFDVSAFGGIDVPGTVAIYSRPEADTGPFVSAGPVSILDGGTPHDASDDVLEVSVDQLGEFVFATDDRANPLPVEFTGFTATSDDGNVLLMWQTASETNNSGFVLERYLERTGGAPSLTEGGLAWTEVAFIEGVGTTSESQTYRFVDSHVPFAVERVAYRIKQIDLNGTVTLGPVTWVQRESAARVVLHAPFPNPARGRSILRYELPSARPVQIGIYNLLGQRVRSMAPRQQDPGKHERVLDLSGLASGTYFFRVSIGNTVHTRRLIVVR